MNSEFEKFVRFAGSQKKAAEMLNLSEGYVSQVLHLQRGLTPKTALRIEQITDGAISKERLIWGDAA